MLQSNWARWLIKPARMNIRTFLLESRRQAKGTRFLWQYSDKWMTESRQEKLVWLRAQMKLTGPVLGAERTGKGYLEQAMERGKTQ
ncbi:transposase [Klebsiella pneumoniae]|uniref:Transposase n=1 Tax=Klebsiella pneumoniae TaxID=573 RepID=A0A377XEW7_KLEPN|nr:transposase [Klebsiella pneumoniae]